MTNTTEILERLIEAGEKATQGEWNSFRNEVFDEESQLFCTGEHDVDDAEFITQAANSRQALKDHLARYKRMEEALRELSTLSD